ncbi:family 43 glycosylhydrolase [Paenibacillus sp. UNC451MF]|uniref:family 43 glycosylhydrolase n=1 Tax=Paenibacillus sp. UNC451MF TaxID=1449063 RepID=UPI00068F9A82|nr:family 43 glycosylhydrolase [Paenibacillus sp. UNC451MF]
MNNIKYKEFTNGEMDEYFSWLDTDGNVINASDGGIIFVDGKYYWYGMKLRPLPSLGGGKGGQTTTVGVVMYSSSDLYNWNYEGVILHCSNEVGHPLYGPMRFERPKVIYNEKTKQFVMWVHYIEYPGDHGFAIGTAEAGVATCSTINGEYEWRGYTRPVDNAGAVRDCTLYKDHDGTGYFIYDRAVDDEDRCLYIVKLSEDYLSFTNEYRRLDVAYRREAAAILYQNGYYFMITSGLTSWRTNPAKYFRAESLWGPWTDMGDPCVNDTGTTFESQSTYILPVEGKSGFFIHMAERHNTQNFERCSYIWLPVEFPTADTICLNYRKTWKLEDFI